MPDMKQESAAPLLVAVDFSTDSEAAFTWATEVACALSVPLYVLHVVHDPAHAPGSYVTEARDGIQRAEEVGRELLDRFLDRMREKVPGVAKVRLTSGVVVGLPVSRILEVAEAEGAGHIVMGGQGRTALAELLLGSKVERVARLSPVPVTIVKAPKSSDAGQPGDDG